MPSIGQCKLALNMIKESAPERRSFSKFFNDLDHVRDWIAKPRLRLDQARLLILQAALHLDRFVNTAARTMFHPSNL